MSRDHRPPEPERRDRAPARERPEPEVSGGAEAVERSEHALLMDDASPDGVDDEADLVGELADDEPALAAEDAAVHVRGEAPGAVDGPDSYLDR